MARADLYSLVTALHVIADLLFAGGLLASALLAMALSFQAPEALPKEGGLIRGVRRWNRAVTGPALVAAWALGLWLASTAGWFGSGWLSYKLVLVVLLSALHGVVGRALRRAGDTPPIVPGRGVVVVAPLVLLGVGLILWLVLMKPF